jgi:hypothetical protein
MVLLRQLPPFILNHLNIILHVLKLEKFTQKRTYRNSEAIQGRDLSRLIIWRPIIHATHTNETSGLVLDALGLRTSTNTTSSLSSSSVTTGRM